MVAEDPPKGPLHRIAGKIGDKLTDKLGDRLLEWLLSLGVGSVLVSAAVFARRWIANEWACVEKPWCEVGGWSLGVLLAGSVAILVGAIVVGFKLCRTRRELRAVKA